MSLLPGLASVQLLSTANNGQTVSNTFHVTNLSAGSAPDFAELLLLATQMAAQISTTYRAVLTTDATFNSVICRNIVDPTTTDVYQEATFAVNAAGTRATTGSHIPTSVCAVLALKTPNASRRFRGHLFLPPANNASAVTGDGLDQTNAYWTNSLAFAAELAKGTPGGSGWTGSSLSHYSLVIWSKKAAESSLPSVANVQTLVLRPTARWLRSREHGAT